MLGGLGCPGDRRTEHPPNRMRKNTWETIVLWHFENLLGVSSGHLRASGGCLGPLGDLGGPLAAP
eukprot:7357149-Pyramimonas_sp.AAC.1